MRLGFSVSPFYCLHFALPFGERFTTNLVTGALRGYDALSNLVLDQTVEEMDGMLPLYVHED